MTPHKPRSVLIVEDERIVATDLQQTLIGLGYDAFAIASSSDDAIKHAAQRCPDLVLMDIRIKGQRDGVQTAELLRQRFGVPVVYLTAHADDATLERAKKTEPLGYLLKPVKPAELRSVIEVSLYRHEMEKRLRAGERWFSTTLHSIADAVVTVDLAGKITYMNPTAEKLIGITASDALGRHARDVLHLLDAGSEAPEETPIATALRERRTVELQEGSLLNIATGTRRLISDSAAPVVDGGEMLGAVMVLHDVTEQRKLQQQIELADRLASLGTMAAGVAHEVNNPLAVVVGNAAFLSRELQGLRTKLEQSGTPRVAPSTTIQRMVDALEDLRSAGNRIAEIVADLRLFSRPPPPSDRSTDVVQCIEWAIRTTAHEFRQRAKLVTKLGTLPPVKADETRLGQVLVNLLTNAAQAIAPGQADRNEIRVEARSAESGSVIVEVRDTGAGISKDNLQQIFQPFFTTKEVGVGTGLGLSICHGIVKSLGGDIQVESELGQGTLVRLLLPAVTPETAAPPALESKPAPARHGRILIVDDEEAVRRVIERVLEAHDVCSVESAREALALIEQGRRFDVILSDLMMPTMTGIEFYERLLHTNPDVARCVVFLSGGATTAQTDAFLRSVPNPQIQKPFSAAALEAVLQQVLARSTASESEH